MKRFLLTIFIITIGLAGYGQGTLKREMRSAWLTTVYSLDWPYYKIHQTGNELLISRQKAQFIELLDEMKNANLNTVFFQVRSRCDAMYKSSYEPWSIDLVTTRGLDPGYDPLEFAIQEAHKRGMELHAWINPYRYESIAGQWTDKDVYRVNHPDWLLTLPSKDANGNPIEVTILNPGLPEVRQRISDIVAEITNNYDVDGIVFDDYFYVKGISNQDSVTFVEHNPEGLVLEDWRRDNVNKMIAQVYDRIKSIKPYVQFGVGPAGVSGVGLESIFLEKYGVKPPNITSKDWQYDDIYSDPLAWMKAKSLDYISPQIYWSTTSSTSPYGPLSEWWSNVANLFGVQFYASHSLSGVSGVPVSTKSISTTNGDDFTDILAGYGSVSELEKQIIIQAHSTSLKSVNATASDYLKQVAYNREYDLNGAPGSVFYRVADLRTKGFSSYLKSNAFPNRALRPALWQAEGKEEFVSNIRIEGASLKWDFSGEYPRFVVYAIPKSEVGKVGNFAKTEYIVDVTYTNSILIPEDKPSSSFTYGVSVYDKYNNEYSAKLLGDEIVRGLGAQESVAAELEYPRPDGGLVPPSHFKWSAQSDAEYYIIEIASDEAFTDILYKREVLEPSFNSSNLGMLKDNTYYYWRVKTRRVSTKDAVSSVQKFTITSFSITSPAEGSVSSTTPNIQWVALPDLGKYKLEVATNSKFAPSSIAISVETMSPNYQVEQNVLAYATDYYARVLIDMPDGSTFISDVINFSTEKVTPPVPKILSPTAGAQIPDSNLSIEWDGSEYASGYEVQISKYANFPSRNTTSIFAGAYQNETKYSGIVDGQAFYLRIRAQYGADKTAWSEVVNIQGDFSSIDETQGNNRLCQVYKQGDDLIALINVEDVEDVSIYLYDISGLLVEEVLKGYRVAKSSEEILISSYATLPKGVYVLNVISGSEKMNIKIFK